MLQKYSDKLYSECCKIFKVYLTMRRRVNFVLTYFSYLASKFLLLIFLNVLLKLRLWRRSLSRVKLSIDLQEKSKGLFLCDRDVRMNMFINRHWKQLIPVTMLKKRLYLRRFLVSFVNFYTAMAFETFCKLFFKFLDDCL